MRILALLVLVLSSGCASTGADPDPVRASRPPSISTTGSGVDINIPPERAIVGETIQAPPASVWAALVQAWADLGLEATERSDATFMLGNPRLILSRRLGNTPLSRYLECGSGMTGPFADSHRIEMFIRSSVVPLTGGSRVDTYIEARARNREGSSNTAVACSSSQRLEREIAEKVRARLAGGGEPN